MAEQSLDESLIARIKHIQIRAKYLVNDVFAGRYESAFKGRGMEFDEVREYFPGDDIRHIDWNVTARMNRPFIKVHRDERELTVMFAVDVSASSLFGSKEKFKNEIEAEIAALLAYTALRNNDKVGVIIFSDHVEHYLPPKKGRGHVWQVIRDILSHRPTAGKTDFDKPLEFLNRVLKKRSVVFLISDFDGIGSPKQLRIACRRHDLVGISVLDPRELKIPSLGFLALEDAETGEWLLVNTRDKKTVAEYERLRRESIERTRGLLLSNGAGYIQLDTGESYVEPILKYFRLREKKK